MPNSRIPLPPAGFKRVYAWAVLGIIFLVLLAAAGIRGAPGVMMLPLETEFHWSRTTISLAIAVNLALFGLSGPFAAAAMQRFGIRRTLMSAVAVLACAVAGSAAMTQSWQLVLLWGVLTGTCTGAASMTLAATVVNRWFVTRRGLAMGLLTASSATGQLIFLPALAWLTEHHGWRAVALTCATVAAITLPLVWRFLPEQPSVVGLRAHGADDSWTEAPPARGNPLRMAFSALILASKHKEFWLLFASFFVCGASTNGYIGSHLIAMCGDFGLSEIKGASLLAAMGAFDLIGTTGSGWLSDRFDNRKLLFMYYGLRGLALMFLPYAFGLETFGLPLFAVFYGLDWIATVPPTVRIANEVFGKEIAPVIFGWIVAGHQLGAAFATLLAGAMRHRYGDYLASSLLLGGFCLVAATLVLCIKKQDMPLRQQS